MILHSVKAACVLASLAALAACGALGGVPPDPNARACDDRIERGVDVSTSTSAPQFMRTLIQGKPARDILTNGMDLEEALDELNGRGANPRAKIADIRRGALASGMAGIPALLFLEAAEETLSPDGRFGQQVNIDTTGRIEAYFYDDTAGTGCLRVLMTTTARRANGQQKSLAFRWTVFVDSTVDDAGISKRGFNAAPKLPAKDPRYPNDAFGTGPGTAADTVAIPATMAAPFEYKLWAKGASIHVEKVERRIGNGSFTLLPQSHPLYRTTAESCIDMMFADYPPRTLPPSAGPPFYCLGRCASPYIVNTK